MVQRKYLILLSLTGMLVAVDQLFKFLVASQLVVGQSWDVFSGFLSITRVHNAGAAFGLFANVNPVWREPLFLFVPLAMLMVIFVIFVRLREEQRFAVFALSLIVGGALGNLADRLRLGHVIDFLDFHWRHQYRFPAFNVADSAITLGVVLLLVSAFYEKDPEEAPATPG